MAGFTPIDVARLSEAIQVVGNTRSQWIKLAAGPTYSFWVASASWGGKQVAAKFSPVADDVPIGPLKKADGDPWIATENDGFEREGQGYVCFDVTGSNSDPVQIYVTTN